MLGKNKRKIEKRLEEVSPMIFSEITDNKKLLDELYYTSNSVVDLVKRFNTINWDINR